jgi:hypothetical protein
VRYSNSFHPYRASPIPLASMNEEKLHLPKLAEDGSNWITYRNRMQWTMKMRGLGDHLTNTVTMKSYEDPGDVSRLSPPQRWVKGEIKDSGLLDATIPDEVFHKVKDTANVKEVWDRLKGEFEGISRSVLVDLGRNFQTTRCSEDDDVCARFSKLAHLREKLSALGRSISDYEYVAVLISSLPSCYDGLSTLSPPPATSMMMMSTSLPPPLPGRQSGNMRSVPSEKKTSLKMRHLPPPKPIRISPRRVSNASIARRRARGTTSQSAGRRAAVMKVEGQRDPKTRERTRPWPRMARTQRTPQKQNRPRRTSPGQ